MAYELSSSVATIVTVDIQGASGQEYQGGYLGLNGNQMFIPTVKSNNGATSTRGWDLWASSSSGWSYDSHYGEIGSSGERIQLMHPISATSVLSFNTDDSNGRVYLYTDGGSAAWSRTQASGDTISHYRNDFHWVWNPSNTRALLVENDSDEVHYVFYDGSSWEVAENAIPTVSSNQEFQGATWIDDTTFAMSTRKFSADAGNVISFTLKSGVDGSATNHWQQVDTLSGNTSTHKSFGSGLHYHTGSNQILVVGADGSTDTYPSSGLGDPTGVDLYAFVSGSDTGILPAALSSLETAAEDIFSWNLKGYIPDYYSYGNRFFALSDTPSADAASTTPKLVVWESGSSGWKGTIAQDSTFQHRFNYRSANSHASAGPVDSDNKMHVAVQGPSSVNSGNNVRVFTFKISGGGGGGGGGGSTMARTKINSATQLSISAALLPDSADGAALGSATKEWSDLYLADSGVIYLGADQDISLTHVADTGIVMAGSHANGTNFRINNTAADGDSRIEYQLGGTTAWSMGVEDGDSDKFVIEDGAGALGAAPAFELTTSTKAAKFYGPLEATTSFTIGSAALTEAELELLDGLTAGTVAASKVVTVDSNRDATNLRNLSMAQLTASGRVIVDDSTEATSTTDGSVQTDGGLSVAKSIVGGEDLDLLHDGAVVSLGAGKDVTLTHVHDTGVLLNSSRQLQFGDSGTYIHQSADGVLDLVSDTEIEINATTVDINGAIDASSSITAAGRVIIDDVTEATSTTDGSLQTDGGLSVAKSIVGGEDLDLLHDGAVVSLGAGKDVTLTHVHDTGVLLNSTRQFQFGDSGTYIHQSADGVLDLVSDTEIEINATTVDINGAIDASSSITAAGRVIIDDTTAATSTTDGSLQTDGGLSVALDAVVGDDLILLSDAAVVHFGASKEVTLTHVHNTGLLLTGSNGGASTNRLQFGDSGEYVDGNGSDLTLGSGADINLTATTDINVPSGVGMTFGNDGEKIEGDGTDLSVNSSNDLNIISANNLVIDAQGADAGDGVNITLGSNSGDAALRISNNSDAEKFKVDALGDVTVGRDLTITRNLVVQGSTTSIDSTTINVSSSFTFEGPADAHETVLHAGGDGTGAAPQADTNLYLPALAAGNYFIPAIAGQATAASAAVTAAEFALLDGGSTVATVTVADGDGVLFNDAGTMKQVTVQSLAAYFDDEITAMPNLVEAGALNAGSISAGFGAIDNGTSNITTGGLFSIDIDSGATINTSGGGIGAAGSITLGAGADAGMYVSSDDLYIESKTQDKDIIFRVNDGGTFTTIAHVDGADGRFQFAAGKLDIAGTAVTATAAELNYLDDDDLTAADLTKLAAVDATAAEIDLIDGDTAVGSSITIADADGFIIHDNGTMKKIPATDVKAYCGGAITAGNGLQTDGAANPTFSVDVEREVYMTSGSAGAEFTMTLALTAALAATPLSADGVSVYLNGILMTPSGSAGSTFDYRLFSSVDGVSAPSGLAQNRVYLEDQMDDDDVLTVQYIKA